jgi:signal peptidase
MRSQRKSKWVGRSIIALIALSIALAPAVLTSKYGFGFSPILTGSMRPQAQPGDIYITRLVTADTLKVGDVIAVNNPTTGVYYSHRIAEIRPMNEIFRITTKGDANATADRDPVMIAPQQSVSIVISRVPWLGRPMVYMNTVQGRQAATSFLVVANILGLFAFLFRRKIYQNFTSERVYRELYAEERSVSAQYREVIDQLQESLAAAQESTDPIRRSQ